MVALIMKGLLVVESLVVGTVKQISMRTVLGTQTLLESVLSLVSLCR